MAGRQFGVELGEEPVRGVLSRALGAPHNAAALMVDDEREVTVLLSPRHLVHPYVKETLETVGVKLIGADPLDDPPDRAPVDPDQSLERRLVGAGRQPRDQALEVARELRPRPRERDTLRVNAVLRAIKPPATSAELEPTRSQIEMPPDRGDRTT